MNESSDSALSRPKLIVGLGNPGAKYRGTRHNIGFDCLDLLQRKMGNPAPNAKFEGQLARGKWDGFDVTLLWPLTFMNLSGRCVSEVVRFYKFDLSHILVICDDMALPLGKLRIRGKGSSGGQKGLNDILRCLGTQEIARLRIGIEQPPPEWDVADYVLSKFRSDEESIVKQSLESAVEAAADWVTRGLDYCMNQHNRSIA